MDCYKTHSKVPTRCPKCGKALKNKSSCKCGYVFDMPLSNFEKDFYRLDYLKYRYF